MTAFIPLSDLGPRICILGPSNSGKSTLAHAIAQKTACPVVHLDQLHHLPHTRWQPRPEAQFLALHRAAVQEEHWVMEGNYTRCLPARLERATGVILLDIALPHMLLRYVRRTLFERERVGGIAMGNQRDRITVEMLKYLIVTTPQNRKRHRQRLADCALPTLFLSSPAKVSACWRAWAL
ncbi:AAA family ATPase [Chimaeribacter californicus]|uniref:AAA family ATPase n=1 Tax=Chimaeribacter californicus TaxID=2060067 RepID=A0A2N5EDS0_9GAMM|nr:AAA family ATPase [Chimaeribacter californicus]PLR40656.1 AAA family ATPase [Chimaeribacter californicus]